MADQADVKPESGATTIPNQGRGLPHGGNADAPTQATAVDLLAPRLLAPRLLAPRLLALVRTIRGQILLAFLVMTVLAGVIDLDASYRIERGGALVTETYDGSLMAINYARAAAADFALMQVAGLRLTQVTDRTPQSLLEGQLAELMQSLVEDLEIASDRSQSPRSKQAAARAEAAVEDWDQARRRAGAAVAAMPDPLASHVQAANLQIELLVNYTAGDGFSYRQRARAAVSEDWWLNAGVIAAALLVSILVTWLLARHIVRQVAAASNVAGLIAQGQLDGPMPQGGADELGALLQSLAVMRGNLRSLVQREVAQRQSAQGRLLDAMESLHEGIVVVDCERRVVLANTQALAALGCSDAAAQAVTGMEWSALAVHLPRPEVQGEVAMADGRWLNISRSPTREGGFVAVIGDISASKEQGAHLEATNAQLDTALASMSQGLCLFNAEGRLAVVNARYSELFHLPPGCVRPGLTLLDLIALRVKHGNHAKSSVEILAVEEMTAVEGRKPASFSLQLTDGRILAALLRPAPEQGWAITYEDVTERRQAEEKVVYMARHDALTCLPNRTLFAERLQHALGENDRAAGMAVLCLDLDRFKAVNDLLGHAAGDMLLQLVAERLQRCVRAGDMVSRMGGDEFTIIQAGPYSAEAATTLARRVVEVTNEVYDLDGRRATVGVSIGIAVAPGDGILPEVLLRNADTALYRAKAEGRGTWRFFDPGMDASIRARHAMGCALREALGNEEFGIRYQPIYDLRCDRVCGFEALLRWSSPTLGEVPPAEFVPVAEELGLMDAIGGWVLRQACLEAARWPDPLGVSVNVSPAQFAAGHLVSNVSEALQLAGLPARRLVLEVTEAVLLAHGTSNLAIVRSLRDLGVRASLDDFGMGYSSLSGLTAFPIDQIKIDRSFIRGLGDAGTVVVVRAIMSLAASLSMRVVAEGVETRSQLQWLREEGCDHMQGHLLSRPLSPSNVPALFDLRISALELPDLA